MTKVPMMCALALSFLGLTACGGDETYVAAPRYPGGYNRYGEETEVRQNARQNYRDTRHNVNETRRDVRQNTNQTRRDVRQNTNQNR